MDKVEKPRNPEVRYDVQNIPPQDLVLNQTSQVYNVHNLTFCFFKMHKLPFLLSLASGTFSSGGWDG
jgi:hypothetical protein